MSGDEKKTSDERERAIKIATIALNRAMAGDLPGAAKYVERLSGTDGLITAILGWCDTYIAQVYGRRGEGPAPVVRMAWLNVDTGAMESADEAPPHALWAGRLIGARAADDQETFFALLRAPAEGAQLGDAIIVLLQSIALGLNDPERIRTAGASA